MKNPAAVAMGQLKSAKKAAAARKNGLAPCKNGKRRGRPAKANPDASGGSAVR